MADFYDRGAGLLAQVEERLARKHGDLVQAQPEFLKRLEKHFDDFWGPYTRIYGHSPEVEKSALRLFRIVAKGLEKRSPDLQKRDIRRQDDPLWYHDPGIVGMMMYVNLFAGTVKGLDKRIGYLRELGVSFLHLMPLLKTRRGQNDGGYAVQDFRTVDPGLGSMAQLRKLARDLHKEDINLVIDFVMNHTAKEHKWARRAAEGSIRHQGYYLMFDDRELPDAFEHTLPQVFPDFAPGNFTFVPQIEKWVWTTFYDFQWDLNYANPALFEAMFREMVFLANTGADVLRLDAVPFIWKRMGTNCQNQPEAVVITAAYRALMRIVAPSVSFMAEAIVAPDDIIKYLGVGGFEGKACDIAYNATLMNHLWHALACGNTRLLRTTLTDLPEVPREASWINYIRCHDDIGWGISDANAEAVGQVGRDTRQFCSDFYAGELPGSYSEGYHFQTDGNTGESRISGTAAALAGLQKAIIECDDEGEVIALKRLLVLNSIVFFMRGIPLLYSGDEIGQLNDYTYLDDPFKRTDNRWVHRPPMNWKRAERRHEPGTTEQQLFSGIHRLAEARKALKAMDGQSDQRIVASSADGLFVVERSFDGEAVLMTANLSASVQRMRLSELPPSWINGRYRDILAGEPVHFTSSDLVLQPYEYMWLAHPENGHDNDLVEAAIAVRVETAFGELVYLTGNIPRLGEWNRDRAFGPLDPTDYPVWKTAIRLPHGTVFEFRWIKVREGHVVEVGSEIHVARATSSAH